MRLERFQPAKHCRGLSLLRSASHLEPQPLAPVLPGAAPQRLYSDRAEIGDAQLGNQEVLLPDPEITSPNNCQVCCRRISPIASA
jgi:hypothetical protein